MERFLDYFVPESYKLALFIDKNAKTIEGKVTIKGEAKAENIKFHAVDLSVDWVKIDGKTLKNSDFETQNGVLGVFKVPSGVLTLEVGYHGTLNENMQGAYLSTYDYQGSTEVIVATQFESHYAREAFPCIDEPAAKAVFELAITLPEGADDLILANTPVKNVVKNTQTEENTERAQNATVWGETTIFEPTPRMSTYLLAWVIGRFNGKSVTNQHGTKITTYAALNQELDTVDFANEVAAKSLEFYDDNFGVPYPLQKLDQVALPDFEAGAMENWGLVTYRETMLLAGANATLGTKKSVALTVAHELSHQWFGDLVTMAWWDDLWLNESFASVMEYYAVDANYPEFQIFEGFFTGDAVSALNRDALSGVQSVHQEVHSPEEIATLFDGAIVYAKGARLMLMLIRAMGWEQFCAGIRDYFERFQYRNTVGDDLWAALGPYAEFDPAKLMHAFIDRPGYPVLTCEGTEYTQKRFLLDGPMTPSDWPLPEVREDMSGHYLINLSDAEFAVRLKRFDELSLEEKLRLLIDRNLLAKTELVNAASLVPLVFKFQHENSAAVWRIITSIVGNLGIYADPDSPEEQNYKQFIAKLIEPKLSEIGLITQKGDDENTIRLRANLLLMNFEAESGENPAETAQDRPHLVELAAHYSDDYTKMDDEVRDDIIDAKLELEPQKIADYLRLYEEIADPEVKFEFLFAGVNSENKTVLERMLALLDRPDIVKPQDQSFLYVYLYRNPRVREQTYQWLVKNWPTVVEREGEKSIETYPRCMANVIRTESDYQKWQDFFLPKVKDPALARTIEVGNKEIKARLKLIREDQAAVNQAIKDAIN